MFSYSRRQVFICSSEVSKTLTKYCKLPQKYHNFNPPKDSQQRNAANFHSSKAKICKCWAFLLENRSHRFIPADADLSIVNSCGVSHLMATLLPSITTGLRASSSSPLGGDEEEDDAVSGSRRVGLLAEVSPLDTSTDTVVTGPGLASRPAPIRTSSPRTLSVSVLGPNCCFTACT